MPRCLFRHYFGCFGDGVLDEVSIYIESTLPSVMSVGPIQSVEGLDRTES